MWECVDCWYRKLTEKKNWKSVTRFILLLKERVLPPKLPENAAQALSQTGMMSGGQAPSVASVAMAAHSAMMQQQQQQQQASPPIATQCFLLSNMFDPAKETSPTWDTEIRDDVIDECSRHGGVLHIYVDKFAPQGNVYVKCDSSNAAIASVNALHGRWFAGKAKSLL